MDKARVCQRQEKKVASPRSPRSRKGTERNEERGTAGQRWRRFFRCSDAPTLPGKDLAKKKGARPSPQGEIQRQERKNCFAAKGEVFWGGKKKIRGKGLVLQGKDQWLKGPLLCGKASSLRKEPRQNPWPEVTLSLGKPTQKEVEERSVEQGFLTRRGRGSPQSRGKLLNPSSENCEKIPEKESGAVYRQKTNAPNATQIKGRLRLPKCPPAKKPF